MVNVWFSHPYAGVSPACSVWYAIRLLSPDFVLTYDDVFSFLKLYYWQLKNKNAKIAQAFGLIISEDTSLHKTKITCVFAWSLIVKYILKLFFPLILLNSCIYFSLSNNSSEVVPMGRNKGS